MRVVIFDRLKGQNLCVGELNHVPAGRINIPALTGGRIENHWYAVVGTTETLSVTGGLNANDPSERTIIQDQVTVEVVEA